MGLIAVPLQFAESFWSDAVSQTHQDITSKALTIDYKTFSAEPFCFNSNCFRFSTDTAVKQINARHWKQDTSSPYDPYDHFDSDSFVGSLTKMAQNRGQLNAILATGLSNGKITPAAQMQMWAFLGNMLHAAEDFYAHSTWVDEGNVGIINFGTATQTPAVPEILIFPGIPNNTTFCGPQGYPLTTPMPPWLVSGFYPKDGANNPVYTAPPGDCLHGLTYAPASFLSLPSVPSLVGLCTTNAATVLQVPGISHDVACSGNFLPTNTEALHQEAYQLAYQEAQSLVKSIVSDLVNLNNTAGFCALLDLPSDMPPCAVGVAAIPSGSTVTLTNTDIIGTDANGAPGKADASCAAPCGFTAAGAGAFDSTASVSDMWIQPGTTTVTNFTSSLHGNLTFTPGTNAQMTASSNWVVSPGAFQGVFGGTLLLTVARDYTATVTCNSSYADNVGDTSSPTDCTQVALQVAFSKVGGSSVTPTNSSGTLSFVLTSGQYLLNWGLIGGTGSACCLGTQGLSGTSTWNKDMTVTFQPIVTVGPPVTLTANPPSVTSGNASTLTWSSPNAISCSAPWTTSTATSGTASTGPLTADTPYSMTCTDANNVTSSPVSVTVPVTRVFDATFTYQGTTIGGSGSVQLGSGSFVYDTTTNVLSAFTLAITNQSSANPNVFNYSLGDVTSFSYNQVSGALNLTTQLVAGTNAIYFPQLFHVTTGFGSNVGNTATAGDSPETSGPVIVTVTK